MISINSKKPLYEIPLPSTEFEGDVGLCDDVLRFQYYKDKLLRRGGIKFNRVTATRTRAERCCLVWHIDQVYDTLAEVEGSSWLKEIRADTQEMWRDKWEMHHYMIYLDSAGCFEVIAESWSHFRSRRAHGDQTAAFNLLFVPWRVRAAIDERVRGTSGGLHDRRQHIDVGSVHSD